MITLDWRLLRRAPEQVARSNCVVTAEVVDPVTADIGDGAPTEILGAAALPKRRGT
ncbi:hypothetical protein [Tessaracoccus caeni]|uniref:hypothetical protein n=1 Tax=Tessaracoccus caeni TaxID=3031239 RepID=UPI0023D984F8|nr:hypothetical protein [Tessaracoccus caeni]MDF1490234.1 hypothetical protein [Tessaracoccus caeni]